MLSISPWALVPLSKFNFITGQGIAERKGIVAEKISRGNFSIHCCRTLRAAHFPA